MRNDKYILKDGKPVLEPDVRTWACWYQEADQERFVIEDWIGDHIRVSTFFLALDQWDGNPPLLWGTLVNGGEFDGREELYASEEAARRGHRLVVEEVRKSEALTFLS